MSSLELNNFVKTRVKDEVARVPGISAVNLMPEKNYSMRIWLDALRMSALNITPDDVSNAIKAQNVQAAAGSIGSEGENNFIQYKVNVTGRLQTVEEFSKIIVRTGQDGHVTRLDDIARIELGAETYTGSSRNNGEDSVNMAVYRLDDANALEAMNGVKDTLVKLQERFPDGVSYVVSYDPTQYISATMAEIVETLIIALILVVGITYVFLQDWRATLIPALAIPVSLIGTFAILLPLGFSINVLTMFQDQFIDTSTCFQRFFCNLCRIFITNNRIQCGYYTNTVMHFNLATFRISSNTFYTTCTQGFKTIDH